MHNDACETPMLGTNFVARMLQSTGLRTNTVRFGQSLEPTRLQYAGILQQFSSLHSETTLGPGLDLILSCVLSAPDDHLDTRGAQALPGGRMPRRDSTPCLRLDLAVTGRREDLSGSCLLQSSLVIFGRPMELVVGGMGDPSVEGAAAVWDPHC